MPLEVMLSAKQWETQGQASHVLFILAWIGGQHPTLWLCHRPPVTHGHVRRQQAARRMH